MYKIAFWAKKKISVVGEIVVDKISYISNFPKVGTKIDIEDNLEDIGGTAAAIAMFLGKNGVPVNLISSLGRDSCGEMANSFLRKNGVSIYIEPSNKTGVNSVYVDNESASRTIFKERHAPISYSSKYLSKLLDSSIVVFDRQDNGLFDSYVAKKKPNAKLLVDTSASVNHYTTKMFKFADFAIVPEEFISNFDQDNTFYHNLKTLALMKGDIPFWVTMGRQGCIKVEGVQVVYFPAPEVRSVDVLGAGDIFRAAFVYGLNSNWDINRVTHYSNVAAALQCTRRGNCLVVPTKNEIQVLFDSLTHQEYTVKLSDLENNLDLRSLL